MIGVYDKNDNLITNLVDSAISHPDVIEIKNRTLDGKWHIQTIGVGANLLDVRINLKLSEKNQIDNIKKVSDTLKVIFDKKYYIGLIDGNITYDRKKYSDYPIFSASFTLLVLNEGDIE